VIVASNSPVVAFNSPVVAFNSLVVVFNSPVVASESPVVAFEPPTPPSGRMRMLAVSTPARPLRYESRECLPILIMPSSSSSARTERPGSCSRAG
jgi:hypothetical protein